MVSMVNGLRIQRMKPIESQSIIFKKVILCSNQFNETALRESICLLAANFILSLGCNLWITVQFGDHTEMVININHFRLFIMTLKRKQR